MEEEEEAIGNCQWQWLFTTANYIQFGISSFDQTAIGTTSSEIKPEM